jgi:hypothetical protein
MYKQEEEKYHMREEEQWDYIHLTQSRLAQTNLFSLPFFEYVLRMQAEMRAKTVHQHWIIP